MPRVTVRLPSLLAQVLGGTKAMAVEASTVREVIEKLLAQHPALKVHLFEESGEQRPHVNVFFNEVNIRWLPSLDVPVQEDDTLTVMQAVSGG